MVMGSLPSSLLKVSQVKIDVSGARWSRCGGAEGWRVVIGVVGF
jgi:hypothetical protein